MINSYFVEEFKEILGFNPTQEQSDAMEKLGQFLISGTQDSVFLLRGYAGTGKTSLIGGLVRMLDKLQQKAVLMAPTGRAAKVFSQNAEHPAYTIHRKIYRQKIFSSETENFSLSDNLHQHTLFIVDEASMIANDGLSGSTFGTGRLLDDLIQYVYSGQGCRLLLMGDTAQLPPVGETESPALHKSALQGYGLAVHEFDLTQVVRQLEDSGILWNATQLRRLLADDFTLEFPKVRFYGFSDIHNLPGNELIEAL